MSRQLWPMKWIVLAMIGFIVPYTYLTLRFRKPASFQPYEDARERAHIARAGYTRISLFVHRPADGETAGTLGIAAAPGGVPADLLTSLIDSPLLPVEIGAVAAGSSCTNGINYPIRFTCTAPAGRLDLASAHLYHKGQELYILVGFAPVADGLVPRHLSDTVEVEVPSAQLDPGSYHFTLVGSRGSKAWTVQVH
jgi:hypothetical protein